MNLDEINDQVLEHLADMHRTRFFTSALSYRIGDASLDELVLYAYGVIAGSDEAEERREFQEVRPHEGYLDCETSRHFWRGVCEARRAEIGMPFNRKPRAKTNTEGCRYPKVKVRGSRFLLSRLRDFFELYSYYPQVASRYFSEQIEEDKGFVQLNGMHAQMAVYSLYKGAIVGAMIEKAGEIMEREPMSGWGVGDAAACHPPRRPELWKLRPIPPNVFGDQLPVERASLEPIRRMGSS